RPMPAARRTRTHSSFLFIANENLLAAGDVPGRRFLPLATARARGRLQETPAKAAPQRLLSKAQATAPSTADTGSVTSQARSMSRTVRHRTAPAPRWRPIPMIAPEETCVVETGRAAKEARPTSRLVARLAANPSP